MEAMKMMKSQCRQLRMAETNWIYTRRRFKTTLTFQ
jgi:hypothetical protein